jgi:hypothetical protein
MTKVGDAWYAGRAETGPSIDTDESTRPDDGPTAAAIDSSAAHVKMTAVKMPAVESRMRRAKAGCVFAFMATIKGNYRASFQSNACRATPSHRGSKFDRHFAGFSNSSGLQRTCPAFEG